MFCFNEFAFTVQVKHKINSTQIVGLILICLYFTTGHFHTCVLCKECSRYLPFLILGSVFSDYVVFYGDSIYEKRCVVHVSSFSIHRRSARALRSEKINKLFAYYYLLIFPPKLFKWDNVCSSYSKRSELL